MTFAALSVMASECAFSPYSSAWGLGSCAGVWIAAKDSPEWKTQCTVKQFTRAAHEEQTGQAAAAGFKHGLQVPVYHCGLPTQEERLYLWVWD